MKKCSSCGFENRDENNFCAKCGGNLSLVQKVSNNSQIPSTAKQKPINSGAIIGLIFILLITVGPIVWWYSTVNNTPGMSTATFTIKIDSDTDWSGAVGGLGGSTTKEGYGSASFSITTSIASACIQKQTSWGYLTVTILKNGRMIDSQTTTASYGVVTVASG